MSQPFNSLCAFRETAGVSPCLEWLLFYITSSTHPTASALEALREAVVSLLFGSLRVVRSLVPLPLPEVALFFEGLSPRILHVTMIQYSLGGFKL